MRTVHAKPTNNHAHDLHGLRLLFILKRREDYSVDIPNFQEKTVSTGMWNSARYAAEAIEKFGAHTKVVIVHDNNDIDREVKAYKATHVFIEGYWVVPEKFDVLKPLHRDVTWIVRCHSETPFLAQEGIAFEWTSGYLKRGVHVAGNSPRIAADLQLFAAGQGYSKALLPMLPNSYPLDFRPVLARHHAHKDTLDISCFGAVRPLKNHLAQAIAAYSFARTQGKKLRFYINAGRVELNGGSPLKNLIGFFEPLVDAELVMVPWCNVDEFKDVLASMDVSMQVSFTETFNIVTADALSAGTPVVTSPEIPFVSEGLSDPTSVGSMVSALHTALHEGDRNVEMNRRALRHYVLESGKRWHEWLLNYV